MGHESDLYEKSKHTTTLCEDDLGYGDMGFTGHPSTSTPNIDALAYGGKILNSWYSGCPVCSGSRTALMTGRQFTRLVFCFTVYIQWKAHDKPFHSRSADCRVGVPGVFGDSSTTGLPLNETTVGDQVVKLGNNYQHTPRSYAISYLLLYTTQLKKAGYATAVMVR